jgi:hypothetical protein
MSARGRQTPRDVDDWFDEPEPPPRRTSRASVQVDPDAQTRERTATPADDWLAVPPTRRRGSVRAVPIRNRRILVAVGIALALLLVVLALAGVFSGAGNKSANKPLTTQSVTTTTRTPTPAPLLPTATVKLGDHGNAVKELQRALRTLGHTVGTIDGVFGASTQSAMMAFQIAHHLTPDGVLGPATRSALLNALRPG